MSLAGLPPIDQSLLPADIRSAPTARKDAYEAGLGFERLLVQQLSQSLTDGARDAMGGDSPYASLLPDALTDGLMTSGGLGLARQLADAIQPATAANADRAGGAGVDDSASQLAGPLTRRQDPPAAAPEPSP
jgi:Rod binding domain-containing protein